jgi:hypothetical protein
VKQAVHLIALSFTLSTTSLLHGCDARSGTAECGWEMPSRAAVPLCSQAQKDEFDQLITDSDTAGIDVWSTRPENSECVECMQLDFTACLIEAGCREPSEIFYCCAFDDCGDSSFACIELARGGTCSEEFDALATCIVTVVDACEDVFLGTEGPCFPK